MILTEQTDYRPGINGRLRLLPSTRWQNPNGNGSPRPTPAKSAAMTGAAAAVLVATAGVLAGIVGTAGGIASLISYPALLAVGVQALTANVANIVALVTCGPGAALVSRPELEGGQAGSGGGPSWRRLAARPGPSCCC